MGDTMPASSKAMITKGSPSLITWLVICGGLYLTSRYNYTLFHVIAETFSIVIACSLFLIAWNTRHLTKSNYILFLGIALLFAGIVDLVHTLAFPGMGIFRGSMPTCPRSYGSSPATCRACRSWRRRGSSIGSSICEPLLAFISW